MIIVSDTSPICYLLLIGEIELLPGLFETILIPPAVARELRHPRVAESIGEWMGAPPAWLVTRPPTADFDEPALARLDDGERDTLRLAVELKADLVLLDDRAAREVAVTARLRLTGTLGILDAAARRGRVDLPSAVARLRRTSFRAAPALFETLLARHR